MEILLVITTLVVVFYLVHLFAEKLRKNRLPGPFPWPIFGNMLQLGENPHLTLTKWSEIYGDVFQIKLGSNHVVVINGKEAIQKYIGGNNPDFAKRPHMKSFEIQPYSLVCGYTLTLEEIKYYRKLCLDSIKQCMLTSGDKLGEEKSSPKSASLMEKFILARSQDFARNLVAASEVQSSELIYKDEYYVGGRYSPIFAEVNWEIATIFYRFITGKICDRTNKDFQILLKSNDQFSALIGTANLSDTLPWIKHIKPGLLSEYKELIGKLHQVFGDEIKGQKISENENEENDNALSYLLNELKNTQKPFFKDTALLGIVVDMFAASTDTTPKSMEWILSYMAAFPDLQDKMQTEIDEFIDTHNTLPLFAERGLVPLTYGFILEINRFCTLTPFTIPHAPNGKNMKINGSIVPSDCSVFVNQWSVNHDVKYWKTPEHFRPERFLTRDGQLDTKLEHGILAFGTGRRKCPGKAAAEITLFHLTVATLHYASVIQNPKTPGLPNPRYGLTIIPETCNFTVMTR